MEEIGFRFKKSFGQNFIMDNKVILDIVNQVSIKDFDNSLIVEIGPGSGVLTKELSKIAKNVLAYEIDGTLENILDYNLRDCSNVRVIYADFLQRDVINDLKEYNYQYLYIVSNLPYYITTPIVKKLIDFNLKIEKMIFMVQKEVGERFCAKPGTRHYNSLSVFLQYYFEIKQLFFVGRDKFKPKPNVDSVVISLNRKQQVLFLKNEETFFQLVRDSFKYKRKTLKNNLRNYDLTKIESVLKKYNFTLDVRAEHIPIEVFVDIANCIS